MGEIPTEHYRFVQVLSTFSAAESLHDPEYRGLAHQAAELLIPLNTHARRLFMAFRKYIVMRGVPLLQIIYQARRALRALGLLLADGTPTVGGGKTF